MPPIPGIDLPGVLKMRTAADARLLKERIETGGLKDALVVGASWVGIKVIEDFYEKGIACTLVDGAKWIFPVAAFRETAQRIQADLDRKSVRQAYGQMLERIEREPDGRLAACMKGGERFSGLYRHPSQCRIPERQRLGDRPGRPGRSKAADKYPGHLCGRRLLRRF